MSQIEIASISDNISNIGVTMCMYISVAENSFEWVAGAKSSEQGVQLDDVRGHVGVGEVLGFNIGVF